MWDYLRSSGIIWTHLGSSGIMWNHLSSPRLIWDLLGSSGIIRALLESSGLIRDHPGLGHPGRIVREALGGFQEGSGGYWEGSGRARGGLCLGGSLSINWHHSAAVRKRSFLVIL